MIKVEKHSMNEINKEEIVTNSTYKHEVRFLGIKLYSNNQTSKTDIESNGKKTIPGFANK